MPFISSDDIRVEQAALAKRAARLQHALDHVLAARDALGDGEVEHQIHHHLSDARASLTVARDSTSDRIKFNEGLLVRVEREEAAGIR